MLFSTNDPPGALDPRDPTDRPLLADWLTLQRALALKPQLAAELCREHRHPAAALRAAARWLRSASSGRFALDRTPTPVADVAALARVGGVGVPLDSPLYPEPLAELTDPAVLLLVRGRAEALRGPAVAIVGSRAATVYGRSVARKFGADLAAAGVTVVSGLARGIDAAAHEGALDVDGSTVAVLACGIDRVYPREHRSLAQRIAVRGAVISEFPLGTPPRAPFFPMRNRVISGLSLAVVVVEGRERSGTLITASHAGNQGRDVFAVPGPITAPTSAGPNRLLREGATIARSADDILTSLKLRPIEASEEFAGRPEDRGRDGGGGGAAAIVAALAEAPASRDELARRLELAPERLALDLLQLELDGRIAEDRDGRLALLR